MLVPSTLILPITVVRRERLLPFPGKLLIRKGQHVSASDAIAESMLESEHMLIDVARALGVGVERADRLIQCRVGDQLSEGDLIAGPIGFFRRLLRSPVSGKVILVGSGQVLIEKSSQPYILRAGMPGEVVELIPDRGAVIETTGALIQGLWGNGKIDFGVLSVLAKPNDHILTADQVDVSLRGSIVLASHCQDVDSLKAAVELPLRGLILASIAPSLASFALKANVPIILLEGFGKCPLNLLAHKLLTTNERRDIAINAESWDQYSRTRPEIVIPLPAPSSTQPPRRVTSLEAKRQVRISRSPHRGAIGTVLRLLDSAVFPSGIRVPAAEIQLDGGEKVLVPTANLEILA